MRTANLQVLRDQSDSMIAHVRRVESLLSPTGLWDAGFQFGDWLDPTAPPDQPALSKVDNGCRGDRLASIGTHAYLLTPRSFSTKP